ncbi:hypothetical protein [Desertibaculum subflavum]|uniref:hypothetical protein n=1 Tax=Desertibaculum subflavum TaxID=2268458 RepID=UPI000E6646DC
MLCRTAVPALFFLAMFLSPAGAATLVSDPDSKCATSNPYPQGQESIRWTGGCRDGLLDGAGTLTWYRDGRWTERNEGTFRAGELHGNAITTFPDGSTIAGSYVDGRRHGEFVLARVNDTYSRSLYRDDQLVEERPLTRQQMLALIDQRKAQAGQPRPALPAPAAVAPPRPAAAPQVAYAAPAAVPAVAAAPSTFPLPAPAVSSMTHARAVTPPWSPIANAAAVAAYPAPVQVAAPVAVPAVAVPAYAPPAVASPVAAPAVATAPAAPLGSNLPLPSARRVCTTPGLYPKGAGWCGVVRREQGDSIEVEVTNVRLNSLFAIGIAAGECTGEEFIGSGDRGKRIWVPARCMQ